MDEGVRGRTRCGVQGAEPQWREVVEHHLHRHRGRSRECLRFRREVGDAAIAHWRYDIVATEGGCTVTESVWDRRPGWFKKFAGLATGVSDRDNANAEHIRLTLRRLKERAEA